MLSSLRGERDASFRYALFTRQGALLGPLDGVMGGRLEYSAQATIRSAGDLDTVYTRDLEDLWVSIEYVLDAGEAWEQSWPLGRFILATPVEQHNATELMIAAEAYDKMHLLNAARLRNTLVLPAGTVVTDAIRAQLEAVVSPAEISLTESAATLSQETVFEPGTTRLKVVNDLLSAIDYAAIYADTSGQFRAAKYRDPKDRGIAWEFHEGEFSIHTPVFEVERDTFNVPNVVVAIQRTDGEEAPLVASVSNTDPDSPFSIPRRGMEITELMEDVEATDLEVLTAKAQRRLNANLEVRRQLTITHAWVPIMPNDVIHFDSDSVTGYFSVVRTEVPLDPEGLSRTDLLEVWL